jgi:hypothetical protein
MDEPAFYNSKRKALFACHRQALKVNQNYCPILAHFNWPLTDKSCNKHQKHKKGYGPKPAPLAVNVQHLVRC